MGRLGRQQAGREARRSREAEVVQISCPRLSPIWLPTAPSSSGGDAEGSPDEARMTPPEPRAAAAHGQAGRGLAKDLTISCPIPARGMAFSQ